jgi:hypothetical protein
MRRPKKPAYPKPLSEIANIGDQKRITNEVEWPHDEDAYSEQDFKLTHVINDRIKPRHFSTLGSKILAEYPPTGALTGDERGFMAQRRYYEMMTKFIAYSNYRFSQLNERIEQLELAQSGYSPQPDSETG